MGATALKPTMPRGICTGCGQDRPLNADGTMRTHNTPQPKGGTVWADRCPGSHRLPQGSASVAVEGRSDEPGPGCSKCRKLYRYLRYLPLLDELLADVASELDVDPAEMRDRFIARRHHNGHREVWA